MVAAVAVSHKNRRPFNLCASLALLIILNLNRIPYPEERPTGIRAGIWRVERRRGGEADRGWHLCGDLASAAALVPASAGGDDDALVSGVFSLR